jgi:hypothetical protein
VRQFAELVDPVVHKQSLPSTPDWQRIQQLLIPVLVKRGFRGTRAFDALGHLLPKPLFIVDEVQDLSLTESELLMSLWFHLERGYYSRLVVLGDLNQQMMPTGFRWEDLLQQFEVRWNGNPGLGRPESRFRADAGWTEDHFNLSNPFRLLLYNYRTSEEIARFARFVAESLVERSPDLPQRFRQRFRDNLIDPECSIPFMAAEEYGALAAEQRLVWIIVADRNRFLQALEKYEAHGGPDERLVLIAHDRELFRELMEPARIQNLHRHVRLFEAIWSKGLEFAGCAVAGVPTVGMHGTLPVDQIGQLYTSFTRAQIKLRLLVSAQEWENGAIQQLLRQAPADCATVVNVSEVSTDANEQVDYLLRLLEQLGPTRVPYPAGLRYADQMEQQFRATPKEELILIAIAEAERIGMPGKVFEYRQLAARTFEEARQWRPAIRYYRALGDDIGYIRCLYGLSQDDREPGQQRQQAGQEAQEICQQLERAEQWEKAAAGWEILREFERAITAWIKHGREWWTARAPGASIAASLAAAPDDPLRKAETLVPRLSEEHRRHEYMRTAQEYQNRSTDEERIKAYLLLERHALEEEAARLLNTWSGSGKFGLVVRALLASGKPDTMRRYAHLLKEQALWEWCAELYTQAASRTSVAQEPHTWQGDVREACEAWRWAIRPRQLKIMEFLGENLNRPLHTWDREGINAWTTRLHDKAGRYGLDAQTQYWIAQIVALIPSDRQSSISLDSNRIAEVRQVGRNIEASLCSSQGWLSDIRNYVEEWLRTLCETRILPSEDERIREATRFLDELAPRLGPRRRAVRTESTSLLPNLRGLLLRLVAAAYREAIVRFVHETVLPSAHPDRHVIAVNLLTHTARREAEARDLVERLWRSGRPEARLDAIRCWLAMDAMDTARNRLLENAVNLDEAFVAQAVASLFPTVPQEQERFRHLIDAEKLWASDQADSWPLAMERWRQAGWGSQALERLHERHTRDAIPAEVIQRCLGALWPDKPTGVPETLAWLSHLPLLLTPAADNLSETTEADWQEAFEYIIERFRHSLLEAEDIDHAVRELEYARGKLAKGDYHAAQVTCETIANRFAPESLAIARYADMMGKAIAKQAASTRGRRG